jgi:ATP-binding cassette subfamily C protein CydC
MLVALAAMAPRHLWLGGMALASLTVLMGMALLGLSGWFIAATALAGLVPATALVFDVFMPSAGIRLLALGRTGARYGERLVTHDATLAVLAALRERLFRSWAPAGAAWQLRLRPARWLQRLTSDVDALDSLYLRLAVPLVSACAAALLAAVVLGAMHVGLGLLLWARRGCAALRLSRHHSRILLHASTLALAKGAALTRAQLAAPARLAGP